MNEVNGNPNEKRKELNRHLKNPGILPEEDIFKVQLIGLEDIQDIGDLEYLLVDMELEYESQQTLLNKYQKEIRRSPYVFDDLDEKDVGLVFGPNGNLARVKISKANKKYSDVYLLDEHSMDDLLVSNSQIFYLPDEFRILPRRVRRLNLANLNYHLSDPAAIDLFKSLTLINEANNYTKKSQILMAKVESREKGRQCLSLYRMNDYLQDPTLSDPGTFSKSINNQILLWMVSLRCPQLPPVQFENNNAKITFIEENGDICLRFDDNPVVEQLTLLMDNVAKGKLRKIYNDQVRLNMKAIAENEHQNFDSTKIYITTWLRGRPNNFLYRAKFLKVSKKDLIKVYFIDWGNTDYVHKSALVELKKVSLLIDMFPPIGINAHLAGVSSLKTKCFLKNFDTSETYTVRRTTGNVKNLFSPEEDSTLDHVLLFLDRIAFERGKDEGKDTSKIMLKSFKVICVNEECIKKGIGIPSADADSYFTVPKYADFKHWFDKSHLFNIKMQSDIWTLGNKIIKLAPGLCIEVFVYKINDFSDIYIQPVYAQTKLKELSAKVHQMLTQNHVRFCRMKNNFIHYYEEEIFLASLPEIGLNGNGYCRVKKTSKGTWIDDFKNCEVVYVDYGFTRTISTFQVAPITSSLCSSIPALGAKGIVQGFGSFDVKEFNKNCKEKRQEALKFLVETFEKKNCYAEILSFSQDQHNVKTLELILHESAPEEMNNWYPYWA